MRFGDFVSQLTARTPKPSPQAGRPEVELISRACVWIAGWWAGTMADDNLEREIAELSARISAAENELRLFREQIRQRAAKDQPIYDDLIRAAEMNKLLDQRRDLLDALERRRSGSETL
jgi:hypothetical protein